MFNFSGCHSSHRLSVLPYNEILVYLFYMILSLLQRCFKVCTLSKKDTTQRAHFEASLKERHFNAVSDIGLVLQDYGTFSWDYMLALYLFIISLHLCISVIFLWYFIFLFALGSEHFCNTDSLYTRLPRLVKKKKRQDSFSRICFTLPFITHSFLHDVPL